jgi:hypothetical protein
VLALLQQTKEAHEPFFAFRDEKIKNETPLGVNMRRTIMIFWVMSNDSLEGSNKEHGVCKTTIDPYPMAKRTTPHQFPEKNKAPIHERISSI